MLDTPGTAFSIANVVIPKTGPKTVPVNLDFTGVTSHEVDLSQLVEQYRIEYVQTIYVDNKDNPEVLDIFCDLTNQRLTVPANAQGYFSLLQPNPPKLVFETIAGAFVVGCQFLNVPVQPSVWGGGAVPFVSALTDAQLRASPVAVKDPATILDQTLALDGTNQELLAAGEAINYCIIYNPVGNANVLINLAGGDPAVNSFPLVAGGSFISERGLTNAVHVKGTNTQTLICFAG